MDAIRKKGAFIIDGDIETRLATATNCLGIIIRRDNMTNNLTARLTTWDCDEKKPHICLLDASKFSAPQKPVKFPCIPQNQEARRKRTSADGENDLIEDHGESKPIINSFAHYVYSVICICV